MMGEGVTDQTWTQDQALASGQGLDDAVRARWEFARRFAEGIRKLAKNIPRNHRRKTMRLTAGDSEGLSQNSKSGGTTFSEIRTSKPSVSGGCTAIPRIPDGCQRLSHPGWAAEPPIPRDLGTFGDLPTQAGG
ncbi:hypothetical protein BHE74_00031025 [Ensete ventricosum]|nr:hypothetical protein GW17_00055166 [Ensete ventricosum]RWW61886.1 hypothetical protein BHE74_00031025 [Ensete ventricosum]RZR93401.1 hypothetical protein BHM03_00021891 [Ensete ventricosum]